MDDHDKMMWTAYGVVALIVFALIAGVIWWATR